MRRVLLAMGFIAVAYASATPARAVVAFTDINAGMTGLEIGNTAWGDYDNDGDLDVVVVGAYNYFGGVLARIYRNDAGTFTLTSALPADAAVDAALAWGDYDRDGDLDLAVAGYTGAGNATKIYRNTGGTFADIGAGLEGLQDCALAWGDYDNDGDLDLAISGYNGSAPSTRVYRNDAGTFVDAGLGLTGRRFAIVSWADVDLDRDLDLVVSGSDAAFSDFTTLYQNNGGVLTQVASALPAVSDGSHDWGDIDNDGDTDMLISGHGTCQIWKNAAGVFSNSGYALQATVGSSTVWGDYDNDGHLDIANGGGTGTLAYSAIYHNDVSDFSDINAPVPDMMNAWFAWGDYDNDGDLDILLAGGNDLGGVYHRIYRSTGVGVANTPPTAPTNLTITSDATTVTFHWNASNDAQTPAPGLSYNLWAGTAPGTPNVMSPMANLANGFRRVAQVGNVGQNLQWTLKKTSFPAGNVYWGVQAIDQAFAGSAFASGPTLTLGVGDAPGTARVALRLAGSNPCRGAARFMYALPRASAVNLEIVDASGRRVRTLVHNEQAAGEHEVRWDGDVADGSRAVPGIYFARVAAAGETSTLRIVSIR